ncbi:MAG: hypothetical protein COA58_08325 [Bacteroidetes bacterium]|nr:MAG: hypothetical protein COA58_08325 [Bacteroidota bacterium]
MKWLVYISSLLLVLGCGENRNDDCITSLGNDGSNTRLVDKFTKIYVEDRIKLLLVQDSANAGIIELRGPENLLEQVTTIVEDGELKLKNRNTCNFVRSFNYELAVKVYFADLDKLTVESIAEVKSQDTIKIDRLEIYHNALSDISLSLFGNEVFVQSKNSAQTTLNGVVRVLKGTIEEISNLDAYSLRCEEVLLDSHTPLACEVNATNGLYIKIYNSGDVLYKDEPSDYKILEVNTGSGKLKKK